MISSGVDRKLEDRANKILRQAGLLNRRQYRPEEKIHDGYGPLPRRRAKERDVFTERDMNYRSRLDVGFGGGDDLRKLDDGAHQLLRHEDLEVAV